MNKAVIYGQEDRSLETDVSVGHYLLIPVEPGSRDPWVHQKWWILTDRGWVPFPWCIGNMPTIQGLFALAGHVTASNEPILVVVS